MCVLVTNNRLDGTFLGAQDSLTGVFEAQPAGSIQWALYRSPAQSPALQEPIAGCQELPKNKVTSPCDEFCHVTCVYIDLRAIASKVYANNMNRVLHPFELNRLGALE